MEDNERTICFCHAVSAQTLIDTIRTGVKTLKEIQQKTCASTGCGGCEMEVLDILDAELRRLSPS